MDYASPASRRETSRRARRSHEHRIFLHIEKLRRGRCELTGQALPPEDLEWHHRDPSEKHRPMSDMLPMGHQSFLRELAKCMCVSRAAHRLLHSNKKFVSELKAQNAQPTKTAASCGVPNNPVLSSETILSP